MSPVSSMAARDPLTQAIGIALIVFGVLLILGEFRLQALLPIAGIVLLVLGILVLVKTLPGGNLIGIAAIVIGILLLEGFVDLPNKVRDVTDPVLRVVNIVAGVLLIVLGIPRASGRPT